MSAIFRTTMPEDAGRLHSYFTGLSPQTKSRFGPHPFDGATIQAICQGEYQECTAYLGLRQDEVLAYGIVKHGYLDHDIPRLSHYNLDFDHGHDYTLAPSVTDAHQGQGWGRKLLDYMISELIGQNGQKVVLWGGVRASNEKAIRLYSKSGFEILGRFEHHGENLDMIKYL